MFCDIFKEDLFSKLEFELSQEERDEKEKNVVIENENTNDVEEIELSDDEKKMLHTANAVVAELDHIFLIGEFKKLVSEIESHVMLEDKA